MGLLNWLFDLHQQDQIAKVRQDRYQDRWQVLEELAAAKDEAAAIREEAGRLSIDNLEEIIGELALAVKAMQRQLVASGHLDPVALAAMVDAVDAEDGRRDGRSTPN